MGYKFITEAPDVSRGQASMVQSDGQEIEATLSPSCISMRDQLYSARGEDEEDEKQEEEEEEKKGKMKRGS